MQGEYLERARKFVDDRYGNDADEQTDDVLARWESVLTRLAADPMQLAGELDWVAKLRLLEGFRDRDGLAGTHPGCSWSICSTPTCVRRRACTTVSSAAARWQRCCPTARRTRQSTRRPTDTRAYFRGECLRRYAPQIAAASWDSVIFDVGRESLVRVPMLEPQRGTRAHVGELLDRCADAAALVDALAGPR